MDGAGRRRPRRDVLPVTVEYADLQAGLPATTATPFDRLLKSRREPISDLESGYRVVIACHLANLSLRLGRKLRWDAKREVVLDDAEATRQLERAYRPPWDAVLKSLLEVV